MFVLAEGISIFFVANIWAVQKSRVYERKKIIKKRGMRVLQISRFSVPEIKLPNPTHFYHPLFIEPIRPFKLDILTYIERR